MKFFVTKTPATSIIFCVQRCLQGTTALPNMTLSSLNLRVFLPPISVGN